MESQKKLIVITGGAGGIGTACAKVLKSEHLIITDYSQEMVDKAVRDLKENGKFCSNFIILYDGLYCSSK